MLYKELRRKLKEQGFINAEIEIIHTQYLCAKAFGIKDDELLFDRDNGLLMHKSACEKYNANVGRRVAPDTKYDCVYIINDDGTKTRMGPVK